MIKWNYECTIYFNNFMHDNFINYWFGWIWLIAILEIDEENFYQSERDTNSTSWDCFWFSLGCRNDFHYFPHQCALSRFFKMEMKMYLKCVSCWQLILKGNKLWISRQMLNICTTFIRNDILKLGAKETQKQKWDFPHQLSARCEETKWKSLSDDAKRPNHKNVSER